MSQTSYLRNMVPAGLGVQAEPFEPSSIETRVNPSAASYYGRAVVQATGGDSRIKHLDTTGAKVLGVVVASQTLMSQSGSDEPNYPAKEAVMVMNKGRIWVAIEEDIAVGDAVYVRHTANGSGKLRLGAFRNDSDSSNCDQLTNARWIKGGTSAQGFALLELDVL